MARFPGGRWAPIPENYYQPKIRPTQVILHTAVDAPGPTRLDRYFARQDVGLESHFWITLDGGVTQMMDTAVRADANYKANRRPDGTGAISIETEDEGDPVGVPWTPAQLDSIEAVIRWASLVHGIPLKVPEGPSDPGVGYHAMWGAPSAWTPSRGKSCPGETRIRQFEEDLLPRLLEEAPMNETAARALADSLYETLLLRKGDPEGVAYWTKVGVESGATALMTNFLIGARTEIGQARATQAAELAALRSELKALKAADRTPAAQTIDLDSITEAVVLRVVDRLAE